MHANVASILGSIFVRFLVHFGSENETKMGTKFYVFWHGFFTHVFDVCGKCFFEVFTDFRITL